MSHPSSSSTALLDAIKAAESRQDMRDLIKRYGPDAVNQAWGRLDPLTRSSLLLMKAFDGQLTTPSDDNSAL